ncbi:MAG: lipoprotein signal peptidase [Bacteroidota bacterium]
MKKSIYVIALVIFVLLLDQALKIWVKTNMVYGGEIPIFGDWGLLHFVENPGMAFGLSIGGEYGKLALSLFRIVAVGFLIYYLRFLIQAKASAGLLTSFALILAGAIGNIIDSAFYGLIFSDSHHGGIATMFPEGGGYASFLHGRVVDMLYFPLLDGYFPDWVPIWGGDYFLFFRPVFNIADVSITVGVLSILVFHRNFFSSAHEETAGSQEAVASSTAVVGKATAGGDAVAIAVAVDAVVTEVMYSDETVDDLEDVIVPDEE